MAVDPLAGMRKKGESQIAILACNDYLRLGPVRSIAALHSKYKTQTHEKAPTRRIATLSKWRALFDWDVRASEYDSRFEGRKNAEREAVFNEGLSLDFERVKQLKAAEVILRDMILDPGEDGDFPRLWVTDWKSLGSGSRQEIRRIVRFNTGLVMQWRGILDDIAKETGGRRGVETSVHIDVDKLSNAQLRRIAAGEPPEKVVASNGH